MKKKYIVINPEGEIILNTTNKQEVLNFFNRMLHSKKDITDYMLYCNGIAKIKTLFLTKYTKDGV